LPTIRQFEREEDIELLRELFWEYLQWVKARGTEEHPDERELAEELDIEAMLELTMAELEKFSPPLGCILLAVDGSEVAGVACMRGIAEGMGEIKRMYVRPPFRRRGNARALLEALIREARNAGYHTLRLDSGLFMHEAQALYRSAGFEEIVAYPESELPEKFHPYMVFMEKRL